MRTFASVVFFVALLMTGCSPQKNIPQIEQWGIYELELEGSSTGNPYMDVTFNATFSQGEYSVAVPGFYDGSGIYRIRFSPPRQGGWTYRTESNINELAGKEGQFDCIPPAGNNHGPVSIVNTYYLQYQDGTPFYAVGTTAYQWTSVKQSIQEKTIQTLEASPFNKIRMCVFPKSYQYGNDTEPWTYPFERYGSENDFSRPNVEFFQNFDYRIKQLLDLGIQADVILFHPYDRWGYSKMGDTWNEKYVRYMIARISAYRNVWWSLANEWDVPAIKDSIDWEGIGTLLQKEDPHQRLRGIHNWYDSEEHFYDHSKPWITHISAQTSQFYNAIKWREQYQKPLLFDEMRYEGDVPSGWGNLTGATMASYFWMAGLSGGYGTHGETLLNTADTATEVRWWAKGGTLVGESPERIRFFKSIMEEAPVIEMHPELVAHGNPENLHDNVYIFAAPGTYYLAYIADSGEVIALDLPGTDTYQMDVIDTWHMKIESVTPVEPGNVEFQTNKPYTAVRLYKNE